MRGWKIGAFMAAHTLGLSLAVPEAAQALVFGNSRNTSVNQLVTDAGRATAMTSGWYSKGVDSFGNCCNSGMHFDFNTNYAVGYGFGSRDTLYRDFWVFDIGTLSGTVTSASFEVFTYAIDTASDGAPSVVLGLYSVMSPVSDLVASNTNRADIFSDLGSGQFYASHAFANDDSGSLVTIPLHPTFVADLNLALQAGRTQFVIGGSLLPEPSTLMLLGIGIVFLAVHRFRTRADSR